MSGSFYFFGYQACELDGLADCVDRFAHGYFREDVRGLEQGLAGRGGGLNVYFSLFMCIHERSVAMSHE